MKNLYYIIVLIALAGCSSQPDTSHAKKSHPSHLYTYVQVDSTDLNYFEKDYVPIYSDIYHSDGTQRFLLTSTVSIRNTSITDSAYLIHASYYDSYGKLLKIYVEDSVILLSPLESIEFVVEEMENIGGAGANFIVDWAAKTYTNQLLIQSVMIGTSYQQGISFITDAKIIKQEGL